jgi:hypothetical protein
MKNKQKTSTSIKKLSLNKKAIVFFNTLKGGTEFNTILPGHQSLDQFTCPQDL